MKKIIALVLFLAILISLFTPSMAAPLPVVSYYNFQPNGTPYLYYSFGDEVFYDIRYDGNSVSSGSDVAGMPKGSSQDGWTRCIASINGQSQLINERYKLGTTKTDQYPADNQDMLLILSAIGQNGPAQFDSKNGIITLYMKPDANLKAPGLDVVVTSLGYEHFQGRVWWSLTNDAHEKERLEELYKAGLGGDSLMGKNSWDAFETLFNSTMKNSIDLSKDTWQTVCGGTVGGYFEPVFEQYRLVCSTKENPLLEQPSLVPRTAEFDKRLLYQANLIFNFTDYTKKPNSFLINRKEAPVNAVTYSDYMCVVSREYLSTMNAGDTISLTVVYNDGSEDTVKIDIKDTTAEAYMQIFSDVKTYSTAWEYINPLAQRGIISTNGDLYGPNESVTYAEFCSMLAKTGAKVGKVPSGSTVLTAVAAEKLLFDALTSEPFKDKYQVLNKQNLWQPNTYGELTADSFAFFDMVLPSPEARVWGKNPDENVTLTRAQSAEGIYRFIKLIDYAKELISVQQPIVNPSSSKILVDGKSVQFDVYTINGNNYFKLRDLAYTLNSTAKQFSVKYDAQSGRINLTANQPYIPMGGEMSAKDSIPRQANMSKVWISVDSEDNIVWSYLTAYNISGNNYFKLRDLGKIMNFGVRYDESTRAVLIDTRTGYIE